jgi:hypothetical protein
MTRKTKNRIFAIPMAAPAIPVKPRMPAINAMTRKTSDQCNMQLIRQLPGHFFFPQMAIEAKIGLRQHFGHEDNLAGVMSEMLNDVKHRLHT